MDPIELAERRYREIVDDKLVALRRAERYGKVPAEAIVAWIEHYVVPAAEELYRRPLFREHATWPQRTLVRGAKTPERAAVERVDRALVAAGKALRGLARQASVAGKLGEMLAAAPRLPAMEEVRIEAGSSANLKRVPYSFGPVGGMMRVPPPEITEGAMVVSLTPHLFQVGDSITHCLMQRVRSWRGFLEEARLVCHQAVTGMKRPPKKHVEAELAAWEALHQSCEDLKRICLTGPEAGIREACITMVQVYAEFHPLPELHWLGIPDWVVRHFRGRLKHNIRSTRELETTDRIATALGNLRLLYRDSQPERSAIDSAIASGGLVLVEKTRQAYWEGRLLECRATRKTRRTKKSKNDNWWRFSKPWELLWKLAMNAAMASPVGVYDLYSNAVGDSTFHNRWRRLKELLPLTLAKHVEPGGERASGYIKMDYNVDALLGTEAQADSPGQGLLEHQRAYLQWIDGVHARFPQLVIENCGSGGGRMDYAMLAHHQLQSSSDQTDYRKYPAIVVGGLTVVLPEQFAVWSYPKSNGNADEASFNMVNAMLGRIHQSGHLAKLACRGSAGRAPAARRRHGPEGMARLLIWRGMPPLKS